MLKYTVSYTAAALSNNTLISILVLVLNDDTTRVEEKIFKGRKTLNASSGLGIRKKGLTLITCNMTFWQVVVPTITFGCEVWVPTDKDHEPMHPPDATRSG